MNAVQTAIPVKELLREFLAEASGIPDINDDTELFSTGIVNSLFAIQLMMYIEKTFNIPIAMDDLDFDNFSSINAITNFVESKQL
jgi:methoxymalonate biosynthesis acyl carrier protein